MRISFSLSRLGAVTAPVLAVVLLAGCAQSPFVALKDISMPWSSEAMADEAQLADTLAVKRSRMDAAVAAAKNAPVEQQQRVAAGLGEIIRRDPILLLRLHAVKLASELRCPAAISALTDASTDPVADIRIAAVRAWQAMPAELAVGKLQEIVGSDSNIDVRLAAIKSLGQFSGRQAVQAISLALDDPDPALQIRATESLALATGESLGRNVGAWQNYVASLRPPSAGSVGQSSEQVAERPSQSFTR